MMWSQHVLIPFILLRFLLKLGISVGRAAVLVVGQAGNAAEHFGEQFHQVACGARILRGSFRKKTLLGALKVSPDATEDDGVARDFFGTVVPRAPGTDTS
jgi:hypothetical protein